MQYRIVIGTDLAWIRGRMKSWLKFVGIGYLVAFGFELLASAVDPQNKTFDNPGWPVFFVIWYGLLNSINYAVFRNRSLKAPAIAFAIFGPLVELVVFKRLNLIVDAVIYAIMFTLPHVFVRRNKQPG
jgi:hypothetical protein